MPFTFRMHAPRASPTRCTSDETAGTCTAVMPEAEMRYVPLGTRHTPPPALASDFKAALNAAVSFVTPSPIAPYVLTLAALSPFSAVALLIAPDLLLPVPGLDALIPAASFTFCPLPRVASASCSLWEYPVGAWKTSKTLATPMRKDLSGCACPINEDK